MMTIIPAIDIIEGKCVRLTEGDFSTRKIYNEQPLEVARQFEDAGLRRLHLVDLDGARTGAVKNWKVLEAIAARTKLDIDFGGGIKTREDVRIVLNSGAMLATVGSVAVKQGQEFKAWLTEFGPTKFLLGADVRDEKIAVHGWQETSSVPIIDFIEGYLAAGIRQVFCTDVSKDGRLEGPATALYARIIGRFPGLSLIASGGVATMQDVHQLREAGCSGVIIGKAIYENRISLEDLKPYLS